MCSHYLHPISVGKGEGGGAEGGEEREERSRGGGRRGTRGDIRMFMEYANV